MLLKNTHYLITTNCHNLLNQTLYLSKNCILLILFQTLKKIHTLFMKKKCKFYKLFWFFNIKYIIFNTETNYSLFVSYYTQRQLVTKRVCELNFSKIYWF